MKNQGSFGFVCHWQINMAYYTLVLVKFMKPAKLRRNPLQYKVFIAVDFKGLSEEANEEIAHRLEEHGLEKIPTVSSTWEYSCEADDETDAKDKAIQEFVNVVRTYPCEMGIVVQAGTSQILRRKKKFDP